MFTADLEYWERNHLRKLYGNLRKSNTPDGGKLYGGLPKELFPGYRPCNELTKEGLTGYKVPDCLGGGVIGTWCRTTTPRALYGARPVLHPDDKHGQKVRVASFTVDTTGISYYLLHWQSVRYFDRRQGLFYNRAIEPDVYIEQKDVWNHAHEHELSLNSLAAAYGRGDLDSTHVIDACISMIDHALVDLIKNSGI